MPCTWWLVLCAALYTVHRISLHHIFAVGAPIWNKFGSLMQNSVQISGKWLKSKPKVDFQYGGRLFFKNGSSYISAVN